MLFVLGYVFGIFLACILIIIIEIIVDFIKCKHINKEEERKSQKTLSSWKEKYPTWYEKTFEKD